MPFLVSAKSSEALQAQAGRLRSHLAAHPELELPDVAADARRCAARSSTHRAAMLTGDREQLLAALSAIERGERIDGLVEGLAAGGGGAVAFLFSGQGSQWAGMGRELYEAFPGVRERARRCCAPSSIAHLGRSLKELLFAPEDSEEALLLDRTEFTQPALFAIEVALYRLVTSFGLRPDLSDRSFDRRALRRVRGRGVLARGCLRAGRGTWTADGRACRAPARWPPCGPPSARYWRASTGFEDGLSLAAVNGPEAVVVSGEQELLGRWEAELAAATTASPRARSSACV